MSHEHEMQTDAYLAGAMEKEPKMKSYQDRCVDTIYSILKKVKYYLGSVDGYEYKVIIKYIIRHYPEVFWGGDKYIHLWTKRVSQRVWERFRNVFIQFCIMSEQAFEIAMEGDINDVNENLYQEHITPVQYVFNRLKEIPKDKLDIESVKSCMRDNKLVLLRKGEENVLDKGRFTEDDLRRLKTIAKDNVECEEAEKLMRGRRSSKSNGSGLFRMCKLANAEIKFRDIHGEIPLDHLSEYLMRDISGHSHLQEHFV